MTSLACLSLMLLSLQAVPPHPAASIVGKWRTTEAVPPGEAPLGPPSFDVTVKDNKVIVTMERRPAADATVYVGPTIAGAGRLVLMFTASLQRRTDTYVIRVVGNDRAEVDLLMRPADPAATGSYVPLGVYVKAK